LIHAQKRPRTKHANGFGSHLLKRACASY
jgi:hypothetical protein